MGTGCGPLDCEYKPAALAAMMALMITIRLPFD